MKKTDINMPIRVLHISYGSGTFGGAARFAINYFKYINHEEVMFDFLFCNKNSFGLLANDELLRDSNVYALSAFQDRNGVLGYIYLIKKLISFLKKEQYSIVHIDSGGQPIQLACLFACCCARIPVRIAHSHSSGDYSNKKSLKTRIKDIIKPMNRVLIKRMATDYLACSTVAGEYMFGESGVRTGKFKIIHNAIELKKYIYDETKRESIRKEYGIDSDTLVFGHVGRFDKAKNHMFLIDVFERICRCNDNSVLWIIGDGELKELVQKRIQQSPYTEKIRLLGEKSNVNEYMQGMDALIFPSIYEGLSIVTIEAQCTGLPIFASSNITKEHDVSGNVWFFSLNDGPDIWADQILKILEHYNRISCENILISAGYSIEREAKNLQKFYLEKKGGVVK